MSYDLIDDAIWERLAPEPLELPILALIPGLGNVALRPASDLR